MPTYAYRCTSCAHEFEIVQKFADSPLTECPECGELIRRVFQPVGIVFKGSGWYITDSRKGSSDKESPAKASATESSSSDAKPAESTSKETSAPAAPAAAATKVAAD